MYKTLNKHKTSNEDLILIIHYVIGILNKYKSKENREIDIKTLSNAPKGINYEIAKELLNEIGASSLIDNDIELDIHINRLYQYLKKEIEIELKISDSDGIRLLEKLRKS